MNNKQIAGAVIALMLIVPALSFMAGKAVSYNTAKSARPGATCQPCKEPLPQITVVQTCQPSATPRSTATPTPKPSATITPLPTWTPTATATPPYGTDAAISLSSDTASVGGFITSTLYLSDSVQLVEVVLLYDASVLRHDGGAFINADKCQKGAVHFEQGRVIYRCESVFPVLNGYKPFVYSRFDGFVPGQSTLDYTVFLGNSAGGGYTRTVQALVYVVP